MNDLRPGQIAQLAGGGLLFVGSLLKWNSNLTGISTDARGLQGLVCLVIGAAVVLLVAVKAFAGNDLLPKGLLGFSPNDLFLALGFAAFVITFGAQFSSQSEFGLLLGWLGAAAMVAGSFIEARTDQLREATPPTPF